MVVTVYGTDCESQRKGLRDPSDDFEETVPEKGTDCLTPALLPTHTHTRSASPGALFLCRVQDSPGVGARKPGPLGTSGGVPAHGSMELPRALAAHVDSIFPTPWTVDRLSSPLAMLQTINSGLGFSHSQESSHRLPQLGEGW